MRLRSLSLSVTMLLSFTVAAGCTTARHERPLRAASSVETLESLLDAGVEQTIRIDASVDALLNADASLVSKHYSVFNKEANKLRQIGRECGKESERMQNRSLSYFENWEKDSQQLSDAYLRTLSEERRHELTGHYDRIVAQMNALRKTYEAYDTSLADLQNFVGNDPTSSGRDLIRPYLERINGDSAALRIEITDLQKSLAGLKKALGSE